MYLTIIHNKSVNTGKKVKSYRYPFLECPEHCRGRAEFFLFITLKYYVFD